MVNSNLSLKQYNLFQMFLSKYKIVNAKLHTWPALGESLIILCNITIYLIFQSLDFRLDLNV